LRGNRQENIFDPGKLEAKTKYYWQIDEVTEVDTIKGELWHFTTQ
jgi:hypothetical protein